MGGGWGSAGEVEAMEDAARSLGGEEAVRAERGRRIIGRTGEGSHHQTGEDDGSHRVYGLELWVWHCGSVGTEGLDTFPRELKEKRKYWRRRRRSRKLRAQ